MILVDSSVIIDIVGDDPRWSGWSSAAFERAANNAPLAINPIIYAEISLKYATTEDIDAVLADLDVARLALPYEAGFLAGRAFLDYRRRGGTRASPMPDFYIGAHAAVKGMKLLTRDPRGVRSYFPRLELIAPEGS